MSYTAEVEYTWVNPATFQVEPLILIHTQKCQQSCLNAISETKRKYGMISSSIIKEYQHEAS